jgi:hypothetical protein
MLLMLQMMICYDLMKQAMKSVPLPHSAFIPTTEALHDRALAEPCPRVKNRQINGSFRQLTSGITQTIVCGSCVMTQQSAETGDVLDWVRPHFQAPRCYHLHSGFRVGYAVIRDHMRSALSPLSYIYIARHPCPCL